VFRPSHAQPQRSHTFRDELFANIVAYFRAETHSLTRDAVPLPHFALGCGLYSVISAIAQYLSVSQVLAAFLNERPEDFNSLVAMFYTVLALTFHNTEYLEMFLQRSRISAG
jgi:hypothetical protein